MEIGENERVNEKSYITVEEESMCLINRLNRDQYISGIIALLALWTTTEIHLCAAPHGYNTGKLEGL